MGSDADKEEMDKLKKQVIYIDNFGNVVTNIKKSTFLDIQKTRPFTIYAQSVKFEHIYEYCAICLRDITGFLMTPILAVMQFCMFYFG